MKVMDRPGDSETKEQKSEEKYLLPTYVESEDFTFLSENFERLANLHK